jgi:signal transduction histidine kinase
VLALTRAWPRWALIAAVAVPALLAAAALAAFRLVGPAAAIILMAGGNLLLVAALLLVAGRRVRHADDALRALEAVPHALFVVDTLQIGQPNRFVNAAYTTLTGYGAAEAVSDGFDATAIFADPAHVAALASRPAPSTTSGVTVRRRDGTTLRAKLELCALPSSDGSRYLLGLLDATGNGERAGHRKNAFLSWLTHELRSPLNACVMWLDVLALAPASDKLTQAVEAIKRNLIRQTRLVNDLSDAAKVQSADLEMQLAPLDLVALVNSHIDAWQLLAIGRQLTFEHRIEAPVARIDGDRDRLLQALNHLLENAIASTPTAGRVQLRMRGGGDVWIVEVEDTGGGLSMEDAANLNQPLWRAPAAAKSRPGLGLGLAVACHIADKHGGTLTATSTSSGALFTLTLPLLAAGERNLASLSSIDRTSEL